MNLSFTQMSMKRKLHLIAGVVLLVLGLYGAYDEFFNVIDFIKGASPVIFIICGIVALAAGLSNKASE